MGTLIIITTEVEAAMKDWKCDSVSFTFLGHENNTQETRFLVFGRLFGRNARNNRNAYFKLSLLDITLKCTTSIKKLQCKRTSAL